MLGLILHPNCRGVVAALISLLAAVDAQAGQGAWRELDDAAYRATVGGKLLMVIQGPDDITKGAAHAPIAQAYTRGVLADSRLTKFFEFRAVPTYLCSGRPAVLRPSHEVDESTTSTLHQNVITYFCTPDQRVLHFLVGYPSTDQLLTELDWAYAVLAQLREAPVAQQPTLVQQAHREKLSSYPATVWDPLQAFTEKTVSPELSQHWKLATLVKTVASRRDERILAKYGAGWDGRERVALLRALRMHAELENQCGHQVLSVHPLVKLDQLTRPLFEEVAKKAYCQSPTNRQQLVRWFHRQKAGGKSCLLIVSDDNKPSDLLSQFSYRWRPKRAALRMLLEEFEVLELNRLELVCLLSDVGHPMSDRRMAAKTRFLLIDPQTGKMTSLTKRDGEARLQRAMRQALVPVSGEPMAAAS